MARITGNVRIHGSNRERLERLCHYVARGSITQERLQLLKGGRVHYKLRRAFRDGTRALVMEPLAILGKLCALVLAPQQNLVTYHGILAPNAHYRDRWSPGERAWPEYRGASHPGDSGMLEPARGEAVSKGDVLRRECSG